MGFKVFTVMKIRLIVFLLIKPCNVGNDQNPQIETVKLQFKHFSFLYHKKTQYLGLPIRPSLYSLNVCSFLCMLECPE
jgi:hypothetical protein